MNLTQATRVMLRTHTAALHRGLRPNAVELKSGPGVGKSSTIRRLAALLSRQLGVPVGLVVEMLATMQSVDLRGFMLPAKDPASPRPMTVFSVPPWMPTRYNMAVFTPDGNEYPKGTWEGDIPDVGILFLDEFGQAEDDIKKASAELLLNGQVGNDILKPGWRVVAASNRMSDRAGVVRSLTFITNRRAEYLIDAHLPTWNEWVASLPDELRPHFLTVSFANKAPDLVFRDAVPPGDAPFCSPRTLVMMDQDLQALRTDEDIAANRLPMDAVAREACAALIGGGEAAQFMSHIKYADQLPDLADVIADPGRAKLPPGRDAQMVCAFMLVHSIDQNTCDPIARYIERLNIDMQVLAATVIMEREDKKDIMVNTVRFSNWLIKNKDLLVAAHGGM